MEKPILFSIFLELRNQPTMKQIRQILYRLSFTLFFSILPVSSVRAAQLRTMAGNLLKKITSLFEEHDTKSDKRYQGIIERLDAQTKEIKENNENLRVTNQHLARRNTLLEAEVGEVARRGKDQGDKRAE
jgi:hypothetical protein